MYNYPLIGSDEFDQLLLPPKSSLFPSSPTPSSANQSIVTEEKSSSQSDDIESIVPDSIISEAVMDDEQLQNENIENTVQSSSNATPTPISSPSLVTRSAITTDSHVLEKLISGPINTPTYEEIFHSSSSSSSEDSSGDENNTSKPILKSSSNDEDNREKKEDYDEGPNYKMRSVEKKLESLFKSKLVFDKTKENVSKPPLIIRQNLEKLNKGRAARPKIRRPIRKRPKHEPNKRNDGNKHINEH